MSEQRIPPSDELRTLLAGPRPQRYVLAHVDPATDPVIWDAPPPVVGTTGVTLSTAAMDRATVQELCQGKSEALHRWPQLDDRQSQLAIIGGDGEELCEYTPGELAAALSNDEAGEARVTGWLSSWLVRRYAEAPPDEQAWVVVAATWTGQMRALASNPPPGVLSAVMEQAGELDRGELDQATHELVIDTGSRLAHVLDEMPLSPYRNRGRMVEGWHTVKRLAAGEPAFRACTEWLLDQIALRDMDAQALRAMLEPDIADHFLDRRHAEVGAQPVPRLDAQRAQQLTQARELVRAYTAAAHSGREREAEDLFNAFVLPKRTLEVSDHGHIWRRAARRRRSPAGRCWSVPTCSAA
ncbi:hypothetical protein ACUJ8H_37605 [Streptomyces sp. EKR5.2]|uniref:hypothetical protein n=1 Tax=Streptomyces sp. EKR5.2 TaxID=3461014 RepID=UPI004041AF52